MQTQRCLAAALTAVVVVAVHAQTRNLVPNPSFEERDGCPGSNSTPFNNQLGDNCRFWDQPLNSGSTADYFNRCAEWRPCSRVNAGRPRSVNVPSNYAGRQRAAVGNTTRDAYAGVFYAPHWYEYLQVPLIEPLQAGVKYDLRLRVSLAEDSNTTLSGLGMLLTAAPPAQIGTGIITAAPQMFTSEYIENKNNWRTIESSAPFTAQGDEQWLTIGVFSQPQHSLPDTKEVRVWRPFCLIDDDADAVEFVYFYIDEVEVRQSTDSCQCPNILIENRIYTVDESPVVTHGHTYVIAGFDVGSPETNGPVIVPAGADVTYKAGEYIDLQPGFTVEAGATFSAYIEPCDPLYGPVSIDFAPNAFSPNGDGQNDILVAYMSNANFAAMEVHDRWGELVYRNDFIHVYERKVFGWDGTVNSQPAPVGVYVVSLRAMNCDNEESLAYNVTLVR